MHFFYDGENLPAYVDYNGTIYSYVHNLDRDTVGLLDSSGALVVEYKYDPWGELTSITGPLADALGKEIPFRDRGNVYDKEIGLYYIQDRYYSPSYQRFLIRDEEKLDEDGIFENNAKGCGPCRSKDSKDGYEEKHG